MPEINATYHNSRPYPPQGFWSPYVKFEFFDLFVAKFTSRGYISHASPRLAELLCLLTLREQVLYENLKESFLLIVHICGFIPGLLGAASMSGSWWSHLGWESPGKKGGGGGSKGAQLKGQSDPEPFVRQWSVHADINNMTRDTGHNLKWNFSTLSSPCLGCSLGEEKRRWSI